MYALNINYGKILTFAVTFYIVIVFISSCTIQFSHQQRHSSFSFDALNDIENFAKQYTQSKSSLKYKNWLHPGQELVFVTTTPKPSTLRPGQELVFITTTKEPSRQPLVYVNNEPAVPTMVPFRATASTTTIEFVHCLAKCPTTSEFNPICATNREVYLNEQRFYCAKHCGAVIEIVRYGSCEGLFPMARG